MADWTRRLWRRVIGDEPTACWEWTGGTSSAGYGLIQAGATAPGGGPMPSLVHRLVWELLIGPIPVGLTIDHLCRNRRCVNPGHMEVVTRAENGRRGATKTNCARGHDLSLTRGGSKGECQSCVRIRNAARFVTA
jgi:hypothetical protein